MAEGSANLATNVHLACSTTTFVCQFLRYYCSAGGIHSGKHKVTVSVQCSVYFSLCYDLLSVPHHTQHIILLKIWIYTKTQYERHTHTHTFNGPFPGLPRWAGTRKVKPIWILLKQETVSGSGISRAVCKSAPRSREITMPAPHYSVFTGRMPFLPPNQQRQSTEGVYERHTAGD